MKVNKTIKILVLIIIVLSVGLIGTTIKLLSKDTLKLNQDTPGKIDETSGNIVEIPDNDEKNEEVINPPTEIPTKENKEEIPVEKPPVKIEDKPTNTEKPDNKDKDDKKDKDNKGKKNNNKDKDKKDKDKKDKKDKKDNKNDKSIVNPSYISKKEAEDIGIKKVGAGAKLIKIESDLDDNPPKYELEIILGDYEYELEIHAITGAVIDFEKDEIDD